MLTPSELKALDKRISVNADKLIAGTVRTLARPRKVGGAGRKPRSFVNIIQPECLEVLYSGDENWPLWVDDVLSGIARLEWRNQTAHSIPLSMRNILKCFAHLDTIDAYSISHLLHIGERFAQMYYIACELTHKWLVEGFCGDQVKYPEVFVFPKESIPQTDLKED